MPPRYIARYYPLVKMVILVPGVGYPRLTAPFATSPVSCPTGFVRLACLIHAANVRSEPGSNPSKCYRIPRQPSLALRADASATIEKLESRLCWHDSKNSFRDDLRHRGRAMCHAAKGGHILALACFWCYRIVKDRCKPE